MILLFGEQARTSSNKSNSVKNNPVENSGVLAMGSGLGNSKSYIAANEYDSCSFSTPAVINYASYEGGSFEESSVGFMSEFSSAVACLTSSGFSDGGFCGGFSGGCDSGSSCGSFSSFG